MKLQHLEMKVSWGFYIYICLIIDIHLLLINYKFFYNVIENLFKSIIGWNEFGTWNSSLAVKTVNKSSIICVDIHQTKIISEHVCSQCSYKLFQKIDLRSHDIVFEISNYSIWDLGQNFLTSLHLTVLLFMKWIWYLKFQSCC